MDCGKLNVTHYATLPDKSKCHVVTYRWFKLLFVHRTAGKMLAYLSYHQSYIVFVVVFSVGSTVAHGRVELHICLLAASSLLFLLLLLLLTVSNENSLTPR